MFWESKVVEAAYIEVALIYLIFSTILEYLQRRGEKKLGKYGTN